MSAELTPEVIDRLTADHYDGAALFIYSVPTAAKVAHIQRHPRVSVNLDSDGNGGGIIVIGGEAAVDATGVDCRTDEPYWAKYGESADKFGLTEAMGTYSTRLKIAIDKVWTTPTG
jgi:PPOX class probable F420-dependent enzyme